MDLKLCYKGSVTSSVADGEQLGLQTWAFMEAQKLLLLPCTSPLPRV